MLRAVRCGRVDVSARWRLADVAVIELRPAGAGYDTVHVMSDGTRAPAPPVDSVEQARQRRHWFPGAAVVEVRHG